MFRQRTVHAQRESVELEPQDSLVLRWRGCSFCRHLLVLDTGNC